jgi:hypothetical protein
MLEAMTKEQAIAEILQLMEQYGLTLEDIFEPEQKERGYELTTTKLLPR